MRITTHQVRTVSDLPDVFDVFDAIDDRYEAGFANYPAPAYTVIVGRGRDWPRAAVVLVGTIVTAFVIGDLVSNQRFDQASRALISSLQSRYPWLVVHDADAPELWLAHGFVAIPPPPDIADPVTVLTWGELPAPINTILTLQGMAWDKARHRRARSA